MTGHDEQIRKIAIFRALHLGDWLCAIPAVTALRNRFPDAEIVAIGLSWTRELLQMVPTVDRFESFPGYPGLSPAEPSDEVLSRFFDRMRAEQFDIAIQMHGDGTISNEVVSNFGSRSTLGHSIGPDVHLTIARPWIEEESEVVRNLELVSMLGAIGDCAIQLSVPSRASRHAELLLFPLVAPRKPVIGIHPGASTRERAWPVERFAEVGRELIDRCGARIAIIGSMAERDLGAELETLLGYRALNLAGATSLATLVALISRLDLVLTNDTGISHVAAATGTRSVVVFGAADPRRWAPLNTQLHTIVSADAAEPGSGPSGRHPIRDVHVAPVLNACESALSEIIRPIPRSIQQSICGAVGIPAPLPEQHRERVRP